MRRNILIRWDDIYPDMHKGRFAQLVKICREHDVQCILGVVPHNKNLPSHDQRYSISDYWKTLKELERDGWEIALHGYEHLPRSGGGMLKVNDQGEFGDLSLNEQKRMITAGKAVLKKYGLRPVSFIAPWHSYNHQTFPALAANNITFLNDGFNIFLEKHEGVWQVPQQTSYKYPFYPYFGTYTICLHPSTMTEREIAEFERWLRRYHRRIVTSEQLKLRPANLLKQTINWCVAFFVRIAVRLIQRRQPKGFAR